MEQNIESGNTPTRTVNWFLADTKQSMREEQFFWQAVLKQLYTHMQKNELWLLPHIIY